MPLSLTYPVVSTFAAFCTSLYPHRLLTHNARKCGRHSLTVSALYPPPPIVTISGLIIGAADVYTPPSSSRRRIIIESNSLCVCLWFLVRCTYTASSASARFCIFFLSLFNPSRSTRSHSPKKPYARHQLGMLVWENCNKLLMVEQK